MALAGFQRVYRQPGSVGIGKIIQTVIFIKYFHASLEIPCFVTIISAHRARVLTAQIIILAQTTPRI